MSDKKKRSGKKKQQPAAAKKKPVDPPAAGSKSSADPKPAATAPDTPQASSKPTSQVSTVGFEGLPAMVGQPSSLARTFSFLLLLATIVLIGLLSYKVMSSFILPLFMAALLVVIFRPFYEWVLGVCRQHRPIAAGVTTATILLVVLGPVAWMVIAGVNEGSQWFARYKDSESDYQDRVESKISGAVDMLGLQMPEELARESEGAEITAQLADLENGIEQQDTLEIKAIAIKIKEFRETLLAKSESPPPADESASDAAKRKLTAERMAMAVRALNGIDVDREAIVKDGVEKPMQKAPLTKLQELVDSLYEPGKEGEPPGRNEATPGQAVEYNYLVKEMQHEFAGARQALMGGIVKASIIEFVNPSDEQKVSWQRSAAEKLRGWTVKLTGQTTSFMGGMLMQLFILTVSIYYFLIDGPQLIVSAMQLSPLDDRHEAEIISEFAKLSRGVVVATLLSAIVQGLLAGVGYFAVWGFDSLFMLIMLTTILAMIPFVGAAAVWVPACLYLAFIETPSGDVRVPAAIGLAIYGTCIVSMADNVIKPMVLKGQSDLHPLFALLSVLGGVGALGPIGVLVGPMVVAFLQTLLKILHKEMQQLGESVEGAESLIAKS